MWFSLFFCGVTSALAAPMPGAGGSALSSGQPGLYYSPKGFRIDAAKTAWVQTAPPKQIPSLVTVYQAPVPSEGASPALTVRVDQLTAQHTLKTYVKKWMQDYSRFGFEVLAAKPITVNTTQAFLLDIVSRETKKQLRQVVFLKNRVAVILNCRDDPRFFGKTVEDCNQIIRTFRWTSSTDATSAAE